MSTRPSTRLQGNSPTSENVAQTLKRFQGIRSRRLRWVLRILSWVPFLVIAIAFVKSLADPMFVSGMLAASLSLFAFQLLMRHIPETLGTLWKRDVIVAGSRSTGSSSTKPVEEMPGPNRNSSKPTPVTLEEQYLLFIRDFEGLLNHSVQWPTAIIFALLGFARFPYVAGGFWAFIEAPRPDYLGMILGSVPLTPELLRSIYLLMLGPIVEPFIGFVIGLMAWRMLITGVEVWRFAKAFELRPHPGHPDGCGGFEPLGNLCLWHALITSIPAIYLGGWVVLGPITRYGDTYVSLHSMLLLVPVALALASFFVPLWSVHEGMIAQRDVAWRRLDLLGQKIDQLELDMIGQMNGMGQEVFWKMEKKRDLMRQRYQQDLDQNRHYPVWPFNVEVLAKFVTSQVIPIIGLAKGALDFLGVKPF